MNKEETIKALYPEEDFIFLSGFDNAILGVAISNGDNVICYSVSKMINDLIVNQNLTDFEAREWLDYNTLFAYFGKKTPVYSEDGDI